MDQERTTLCQEALKALEDSTILLTVAEALVKVGNYREADRLRREARLQRNLSVRLMTQANISESKNFVGAPQQTEPPKRAVLPR